MNDESFIIPVLFRTIEVHISIDKSFGHNPPPSIPLPGLVNQISSRRKGKKGGKRNKRNEGDEDEV